MGVGMKGFCFAARYYLTVIMIIMTVCFEHEVLCYCEDACFPQRAPFSLCTAEHRNAVQSISVT